MRTTASETVAHRMAYVLEEHFGGDRKAMAEAAGVSLSSVSRYLSGEMAPLPRVIRHISDRIGFPLFQWLVKGEGPRPSRHLVAGTRAESKDAYQLGVYAEPTTRKQLDDEAHQPTEWRSTSPAMHAASRYYLRLWADIPRHRVQRGDLLLFESDRAWFRPPHRHVGRLCYVKRRGFNGLGLVRPAGTGPRGNPPLEVVPCIGIVPLPAPAGSARDEGAFSIRGGDIKGVCVRLERDDLNLMKDFAPSEDRDKENV